MVISEDLNKVMLVHRDTGISSDPKNSGSYLQITIVKPLMGAVKVIRLSEDELQGLMQFISNEGVAK